MKPTEQAITLLVIFILLIFIIMGVIKSFENNTHEEHEQWKEDNKNEPYNREEALERLRK